MIEFLALTKPVHKGLAAALCLLAGVACLSPTVADAQTRPAPSCFWPRDVRDFRSIDNRTVYIRVNSRDVYELKLFARCPNMSWSRGVSLRSRGSSRVCEGNNTWLEIYAHTGSYTRRCQVTEVRRLSAGAVAALPKAAQP